MSSIQIRSCCGKSTGPRSTRSTERIVTKRATSPSSSFAPKAATCGSSQVSSFSNPSLPFETQRLDSAAASWFWDNHVEHLDLFDCRNTQWQVLDPFFTPPALTLVAIAFRYINAATNSKNVLIMLDMSGSMLGQRYEIAKQTTEAILETLSHNDYFNIMPVRDAEL